MSQQVIRKRGRPSLNQVETVDNTEPVVGKLSDFETVGSTQNPLAVEVTQPIMPDHVQKYIVCGQKSTVKVTDPATGASIKGAGKVGYGGIVYLTPERAAQLGNIVCLPESFGAGLVVPAAIAAEKDAEIARLKAELAER